MLTRRLVTCTITGAILGFVCIIGAQVRSGFEQEALYLTASWYNRLIMGLMIGLAMKTLDFRKILLRGALLGFIVSFAFFVSTGMNDIIGLLAGIVYGVIIEYAGLRFGGK